MILPDVNVLVYGFRVVADRHEDYRRWLERAAAGPQALALTELTASGFLRIVTHHRIFDPPAPTSTAADFLDRLAGSPRAVWLPVNEAVWASYRRLVAGDPAIRGPLVPDAFLAASAIAHGAQLATADRGMARFPGLRHFDPVSAGAGASS